jgi:Ribosome biogenesis protein SLX9
MPKISKERKFRASFQQGRAAAALNDVSTGRGGTGTIQTATAKDTTVSSQSLPNSAKAPSGAQPHNSPKVPVTATRNKKHHPEVTSASQPTRDDANKTATGNPSPPASKSITNHSEPVPLLSKGQRKRQAKRDQYLKKEKMILSSLQVKHAQDQAKRIDGLDALKEALMATVAQTAATSLDASTKSTTATNASLLQSNRGRKLLLEKEAAQMNLVWQHPSFQANPLETIREHLQNTLQQRQSTQPKVVPSRAKSLVSGNNSSAVNTPRKSTLTKGPSPVKRKRKQSKVRATRSKTR